MGGVKGGGSGERAGGALGARVSTLGPLHAIQAHLKPEVSLLVLGLQVRLPHQLQYLNYNIITASNKLPCCLLALGRWGQQAQELKVVFSYTSSSRSVWAT